MTSCQRIEERASYVPVTRSGAGFTQQQLQEIETRRELTLILNHQHFLRQRVKKSSYHQEGNQLVGMDSKTGYGPQLILMETRCSADTGFPKGKLSQFAEKSCREVEQCSMMIGDFVF